MLFKSEDIGIDLGTSSILVCAKDRGILYKEPSVVAISTDDKEPVAFGEEARKMIGRTPDNVKAIRPLKNGVISDISLTEKMIKHYMEDAISKASLRKPRVVICVPCNVTEIEKKAVEDATINAGAREVEVIVEPIAAALGADIDISKPEGSMVVDIGGGTTDIAVISLGGIVASRSVKVAGDDFDQAIIDYLKTSHSLLIGERTAENIKIEIGRAIPVEEGELKKSMVVKGRNTQNGYPGDKNIDDEEIYEALKSSVNIIIDGIKKVFENTPPELAADIFEKGIYLTGGGGKLWGLDKAISNEIGVEVLTVDDPIKCVCKGLLKTIHTLSNK